jgi:hypothetical protein
MTVLNPDLEKNKNVIRYFLQQLANDDFQAVCVIETPEFKLVTFEFSRELLSIAYS